MRTSLVRRSLGLALLGSILVLSGCAFRPTESLAPPAFHITAPQVDLQTTSVVGLAPLPKPSAPKKQDGKDKSRLEIPERLPGADAPPIELPPIREKEARKKALDALFAELPVLPTWPIPAATKAPTTLSELQHRALRQNPRLQQAATAVEVARGKVVQAGLYPNPVVGYITEEMGSGGTAGQQGAFISQQFKTAGKLELAQLAAAVDVASAKLKLRNEQVEVMAEVRQGFFEVLVAKENLAVTKALVEFADNVYRVQVALVKGGQAAAYEPMQVYVLAVQARGNYVQARNRYLAAWRRLAASLNEPNCPPVELAGRADASVPLYPYEMTLSRMLAKHTDLGVAQNNILRAQRQLCLAQANVVPDINAQVQLTRDNTANPADTLVGVQAGIAIPLWNRNQGNLLSARARLARALKDVDRVKNDLSQQLADAYEKYENATTLVGYYRDRIIPAQVQVYRAIYARHQQEPDAINFNDIVTSQQTLATAMRTYLQSLRTQWQAVVELARLMQADDLYEFGRDESQAAMPTAPEMFAPELNDPKEPAAPAQEPIGPLPSR